MLTILFNQMLRFWGNNQTKVAKPPTPDELRQRRMAQDEQDIEDIVAVLTCFVRCQR